jgi:hypothetical protein
MDETTENMSYPSLKGKHGRRATAIGMSISGDHSGAVSLKRTLMSFEGNESSK